MVLSHFIATFSPFQNRAFTLCILIVAATSIVRSFVCHSKSHIYPISTCPFISVNRSVALWKIWTRFCSFTTKFNEQSYAKRILNFWKRIATKFNFTCSSKTTRIFKFYCHLRWSVKYHATDFTKFEYVDM